MLWRDYKEGGEKFNEDLPGEPPMVMELEESPEEPQELPMEPIPEGTFGQLSEKTLEDSGEDTTPDEQLGESVEEPQEDSFEEIHEETPQSPVDKPQEAPAVPEEQPDEKVVEGTRPHPPPPPSRLKTEQEKVDEGKEPAEEAEWVFKEESAITPLPEGDPGTGEEPKPETEPQKIEEKRRPPRPPRKHKVKIKKKMLIKKDPET